MSPTLIGYFPKRTTLKPDWSGRCAGAECVVEICSVSNCMASGPKDWMERWLHNAFWVFDTPELAWSMLHEAERAEFQMYGYRMFPIRFTKGNQEPWEVALEGVEPLPGNFVKLGYDAVSRHHEALYECSPLSCNGMAAQWNVNRFCLVETEAEGLSMALDFSVTEPEPGPYFLVEVWRAV